MKIGFDIDDTLINLREHAFHIYNKKLNKNLDLSIFRNIKRVEIHEPFGLNDEEGNKMWKSSLEEIYYSDCPPFNGAVETLNKLDKEGHEIFYITARPKEHGKRSMDWLKKQGFPVQEERFYYGMQDDEKVHIIQDLDLDYYIDDKPAILETLKNGRTTLLIKDQPYNKDKCDITRIMDWNDFYQLIQL
ncbi:5' nucleotidase, NT5C type [Oceanobacillus senegalensis]|uniref:5' nucleotidase, NT5C type n=1 Tax=Oceanobacillus senegalensis TaxID=1936063 RepID=UPI000A30C3F4|nr:HAD family acid phosphatase [Oceanobacillus senegalensis]